MKRPVTLLVVLAIVGVGLMLLNTRHPRSPEKAEFSNPNPTTRVSQPMARATARPPTTGSSPPAVEQGPVPRADPSARAIVRGRVIDPAGKPVPRALVVLRAEEEAVRTVRTDPEGRFQITTVPHSTQLAVQHPSGWAIENLTISPHNRGPLVIVLEPGRSITGVVQTSDGIPVPLAPIVWWVGETLSGAEQADIEGRFVITGLPPGESTGLAVASGHGSIEDSTILVPPGETAVTLTVPGSD